MTFASWVERFARFQARKPWLPLVVCFVVGVLATLEARTLELRTRFDQLLPDSQPSVIELRRVSARTSAATSIYVVLEGDDTKTLRAFGDALLPPLRALGPNAVTSAVDGVQISRAFLMPRAGLFQTRQELEKLRADVDARWDWEVAKEQGDLLDESNPPPPLTAAELKKRFEGKNRPTETEYPDGYFQSKDGKAVVVVVATPAQAGDLGQQQAIFDRVKGIVASSHTGPYANLRIGYAGDLVTGLAEYGAVKQDLVQVGIVGVGLVLLVILLFFARVRALLVMGFAILLGLAWTFGLTAIVIGHLNVATGFLFSIVAGNGINFGIIWLGRFYEERRGGSTLIRAVEVALARTYPATMSAAAAAATAYAALAVG
ncbi:MAG TPA: MMPL family transporter, partial [Labilithrix sp.]